MNPSEWINIGQILASTVVGTATVVWWLSRKFSETRTLIYEKIDSLEDNIIKKLEYHEKHDDDRFAEVRNTVWEMKVRNAAREGLIPPTKKE